MTAIALTTQERVVVSELVEVEAVGVGESLVRAVEGSLDIGSLEEQLDRAARLRELYAAFRTGELSLRDGDGINALLRDVIRADEYEIRDAKAVLEGVNTEGYLGHTLEESRVIAERGIANYEVMAETARGLVERIDAETAVAA
ncbi:MAG: hypothetical protein JWN32_647 [Solirubrobacterales bacterium]|jgi:hypothetical protein|nr:hypothetical protein [Solirubrobacterales bacterium]